MKVSLNTADWLSNVDLTKIGVDTLIQKIGAQLGAVEEVTHWGPRYDGIVVAKVVGCVQHPNADKLRVCTIDDGGVTQNVARNNEGYVEVVCGAPNAREGIIVAWLPPGSTVPSSIGKDPFVLGARELRGVVSNGMLGSPKELGIGDDHSGILEINPAEVRKELIVPGSPFKKLYSLDDVIIDCENKMFTHRPDCFGTLGVARELAGIQQLKFRSPGWYTEEAHFENAAKGNELSYGVKNELIELVPRYMLVGIANVKIGPSPIWLQAYLSRVGIRPINNIVDTTNYIMMITGQPLHAFDFDKVAKNGDAQIIIRSPKKDETITLLDGKTITPREEAIMICNEDKPIALGGVMGGGNSEIDENTKNILIECANFNMYNVRRTSMEHGIFTEAVTRLNKGQSPWQCPVVLAKAIEMVLQVSPGAEVGGKPADSKHIKHEHQSVKISAEFVNERLGSNLTLKDIEKLLENVEFKITTVPADKHRLHVMAPFWRMDIELPEDIVEEIGRLHGYSLLPTNLPARSAKAAPHNELLSLKTEIRTILAEAGANEVVTYSFVHGALLKKVGQPAEEAYAIRNALSPDLQYYRLSLTPSLLDKVNMNLRAGYDEFALFELNRTHIRSRGLTDEKVPKELNMLSLVYTANDKTAPEGAAFYQARKYLEFLTHKLGITPRLESLSEEPTDAVYKPFDWKRSASVTDVATGTYIGIIGEYRSEVRAGLKLPIHSAGFELSQDAFLAARKPLAYTVSSRFPSQSQDLTLETPAAVRFNTLVHALEDELKTANQEHGYTIKTEAQNIYRPDELKLRYTFRITISHFERTLVTAEVNALLDNVAAGLKARLPVERI
ncbi:MAG: Phenylalanine-tRNA ligase beta subunit [Candidatus Saccharibacteria bacterium]|nr:Phenylalanine-tRNA ligase beta subunit [Candidatus Saccharibacteria bacterium]